MVIAICDDEEKVRMTLKNQISGILQQKNCVGEILLFRCGEEVIQYAADDFSVNIDLLFLDIEMAGINGIDLMNLLRDEKKIWRICFVSNYAELVFHTFSKKTIGFIPKPFESKDVERVIRVIKEELEENAELSVKGLDGFSHIVRLEDLAYIKSDGGYTKLVFMEDCKNEDFYCVKGLGELEKHLKTCDFIRIHKSYLVNLQNVADMQERAYFHNAMESIPIGRAYRREAKKLYHEFCARKVKRRLL